MLKEAIKELYEHFGEEFVDQVIKEKKGVD